MRSSVLPVPPLRRRFASATLLALALAAAPLAYSQGPSLGAYILSAREDGALRARTSDRDLAFGTYPGLPLLRDVEVRVRNDALDPANMRYSLRLEPRGFGEGRASRAYNRVEVRRSQVRNALLLNRALLERYLLAVDHMMWASLRRVNAELISVSEDRIRVLEKRKGTEDFELDELIEAEVDLTKQKSEDLDIAKEMALLEQTMALHMGRTPDTGDVSSFPGFDTAGLVKVDSIIALVEGGRYALDTAHVYLEYLKRELELAESRYRLEKAERRQWLSYLSFSYDVGERLSELERRDDGKDYDLGRAYILEAGFRLPSLTDGNQDLNRRKEELLSEKEDYQQSRRELEDIMRKDIRDIRSLIVQYRYLKAREEQVDAQASLKKYMQVAGSDPLVLLSIKAGSLKNTFKLEEVRFGIVRNWIKVLDAAGRLSAEPLRNHLLAGGPELKP
jgi:hypothetical protein